MKSRWLVVETYHSALSCFMGSQPTQRFCFYRWRWFAAFSVWLWRWTPPLAGTFVTARIVGRVNAKA